MVVESKTVQTIGIKSKEKRKKIFKKQKMLHKKKAKTKKKEKKLLKNVLKTD